MHANITWGLYISYPIFHCGLYCRAVSVTDNLCSKQGNSSIFESKIRGLWLERFQIKSGLWWRVCSMYEVLYKNNTTFSLLRFLELKFSKIIPKPIPDDVYFLREFEHQPITYLFGGKMFVFNLEVNLL